MNNRITGCVSNWRNRLAQEAIKGNWENCMSARNSLISSTRKKNMGSACLSFIYMYWHSLRTGKGGGGARLQSELWLGREGYESRTKVSLVILQIKKIQH